MTDFTRLLTKYPPKHGERTIKAVRRNIVAPAALEPTTTGSTDWRKQDSLLTGPPNASLNDPIPVRGVTQTKKKKPGRGK